MGFQPGVLEATAGASLAFILLCPDTWSSGKRVNRYLGCALEICVGRHINKPRQIIPG